MSVSTITPANIVGMGAEGIAETLVVGLLTSQGGIDSLLVANGGQVNGTVRAGFLDEGELPDRPRIVANVIEDETDFSKHPKLADVTVSVTLETTAQGLASDSARADGDHKGTNAIEAEKMRQTIREALCDQSAWSTYLEDLQTALGETALGFTIRTLKIETGATEEGEDATTRNFETRLRMLLEASTTWADVVIPGGSIVTINLQLIVVDVTDQVDGTETVFTAPGLCEVLLVFRNGVKVLEDEITISGNEVTFVNAPQVGIETLEFHGTEETA